MPRASSRRLDAGEIQRGALAGDGLLRCRAVHLHAAHPQPLAAGMHLQLLLFVHRAGNQRAGDDRAEALHGEDAIDGQAKDRSRILGRNLGGQTRQLALELIQARTGLRADRDDRAK